MSFLAIFAGALLAALLLGLVATAGMHRDRGFYAAMLIAIAFFYPVFSAERFDFGGAGLQALIALGFLGVAVAGYRAASGGIIALGLVAHATYDVFGLVFGVHAPALWAELCIGFDWVLALGARAFLPRG